MVWTECRRTQSVPDWLRTGLPDTKLETGILAKPKQSPAPLTAAFHTTKAAYLPEDSAGPTLALQDHTSTHPAINISTIPGNQMHTPQLIRTWHILQTEFQRQLLRNLLASTRAPLLQHLCIVREDTRAGATQSWLGTTGFACVGSLLPRTGKSTLKSQQLLEKCWPCLGTVPRQHKQGYQQPGYSSATAHWNKELTLS